MPAISAVTGIITGNKQAKAARRASDAEIAFAEETRDLVNKEADRSFRQGSRILTRSRNNLERLYNEGYDATGNIIDEGFGSLRDITDSAYRTSFDEIYNNRDNLLATTRWGYDAGEGTIAGAERGLTDLNRFQYDAGGQIIGQTANQLQRTADWRYGAGGQVLSETAGDLYNTIGRRYSNTGDIIDLGFDAQMGVFRDLRSDLIGEGGFKESPGYNFRRQEALDAVEASAAARGGLFSGATGKRLTEVADGYAADEWDRYRGDLKDLASMESGIYDWRTGAMIGNEDQYATDRTGVTSSVGAARAGLVNQYATDTSGITAARGDALRGLVDQYTNNQSGVVSSIADARLRNQGNYVTGANSAIDAASAARLNLEADNANALTQIYDWRTGQLLNRENVLTDGLTGVRAGDTDARLNLLANRTNARVGAGSQANATIGNSLARRAYGQADAFTTQVNGVTQGIQNGIRLYGAFS